MHPYSIDSNERQNIAFYLAIIAIGLAWLLNVYLPSLGLQSKWYIDAPSVMGFYAILYFIFDRWLWKWGFLRKLGIVQTPIIIGSWKGEVVSSFAPQERKNVKVKIRQTWTHLQINLENSTSKSHSLIAGFSVNSSRGCILSYQYQNDPLPNTLATMQIHYGTATIECDEQGLKGEYYSGRGRTNHGSITLQKE